MAVFVLAVAAAGCASRSLISRDDLEFLRAQAQFQKTQARVQALNAPPDEAALFLQGELFYRYRFQLPRPGFGSAVAQAAAVLVDVPALESLAGSLDFVDLRLRAYDGAVQLWETLLAQHPGTPLRALTLYRLGWAYRSSGAAGLPRTSGDEAFELVDREQAGAPLGQLAHAARGAPWKSKQAATAWSAVPGLGQMYLGERVSGVVRLGIALTAAAMVVVPTVIAYERNRDLSLGADWPLLATGLAGVVVLSFDYTTAYKDAMRGVIEWNERIEAAFEARHPDAP
jgi:hypothetical protein